MPRQAADLRLFVALWPPPGVVREIEALRRQLPPVGRPVAAGNIHITLAFLGNVSAARLADCEQALSGVLARVFPLTMDRLGWWRRSRVLWLGTRRESPGIQHLAEQVQNCLEGAGFPRERRAFRTHVSLARKVDRSPRLPDPPPIGWAVDRFTLTASDLHPDGARYRRLREWALSG